MTHKISITLIWFDELTDELLSESVQDMISKSIRREQFEITLSYQDFSELQMLIWKNEQENSFSLATHSIWNSELKEQLPNVYKKMIELASENLDSQTFEVKLQYDNEVSVSEEMDVILNVILPDLKNLLAEQEDSSEVKFDKLESADMSEMNLDDIAAIYKELAILYNNLYFEDNSKAEYAENTAKQLMERFLMISVYNHRRDAETVYAYQDYAEFYAKEDDDVAILNYKIAIHIADQIDFNDDLCTFYLHKDLADCYCSGPELSFHDVKSAIEYYQKTINISEKSDFPEDEKENIEEVVSDIRESLNSLCEIQNDNGWK